LSFLLKPYQRVISLNISIPSYCGDVVSHPFHCPFNFPFFNLELRAKSCLVSINRPFVFVRFLHFFFFRKTFFFFPHIAFQFYSKQYIFIFASTKNHYLIHYLLIFHVNIKKNFIILRSAYHIFRH